MICTYPTPDGICGAEHAWGDPPRCEHHQGHDSIEQAVRAMLEESSTEP